MKQNTVIFNPDTFAQFNRIFKTAIVDASNDEALKWSYRLLSNSKKLKMVMDEFKLVFDAKGDNNELHERIDLQ